MLWLLNWGDRFLICKGVQIDARPYIFFAYVRQCVAILIDLPTFFCRDVTCNVSTYDGAINILRML
ncbi:MAG: hypothetical protein CLLPBCKN_000071 [Chroococcidiopsis cubana SAG 39.79]|nr:hypothetical protein [Chroococcidiopsis cubana SAG 39.79]